MGVSSNHNSLRRLCYTMDFPYHLVAEEKSTSKINQKKKELEGTLIIGDFRARIKN